ncbi:hypothetical protein CDH04_04570 [Francisella adeliensis]|uniref:DUF2975 domain-containing protein n=2 Tax=Francisella adeliensis TaxID=2007306 RepID=A0A2Z4XY66_9GAMM|nr:hypothetical protein CDH04_04570 [Francisella adeliensis]QIW11963.1 DUF2975 domain-containing protein [Francisella adeliensis]QIW13839.1 DUF2975 domain-containing protein [Francisella adeliensis]
MIFLLISDNFMYNISVDLTTKGSFMKKIKSMSKKYRVIFQLMLVLVIVVTPIFWLTVDTKIDIFSSIGMSSIYSPYINSPMLMSTRIFAIIVSLIPISIVSYALIALIRLFKFYEQGNIFSVETVNQYKKLGKALIFWFFGIMIYDALISLVLTMNNPVGHRVISITIGGIDILAIIAGSVVLIISSVMQQAQEIADENSLTI